MSDLKTVCGLWKKMSKSGNVYMSGKTQEEVIIPAGTYVNVFKTKEKKSEDSPDYTICYAPPSDQPQPQPQQQQQQEESVDF